MDGGYSYFFGLPVTLANIIWFVQCVTLTMTYISNHVVKSQNFGGKLTQYLTMYGKTKGATSHLFDLPKRYFTHYYIVASLWNVLCFITVVGLSFGFLEHNWISNMWGLKKTPNSNEAGDQLSILLVLLIITLHSMKRLYECLFVSVFSSTAKISLPHYLWGFLYYLLLPPTLISECLPLKNLPFGSLGLHHVVGLCGMAFASFMHHQSHIIFANMRKGGRVKSNAHGIPMGGFFSLVSCPHYLAEILVYVFTLVMVGHACRSWWLVLAYNVLAHANMAMSAHEWYKKTFSTYPPERRALFPWLF